MESTGSPGIGLLLALIVIGAIAATPLVVLCSGLKITFQIWILKLRKKFNRMPAPEEMGKTEKEENLQHLTETAEKIRNNERIRGLRVMIDAGYYNDLVKQFRIQGLTAAKLEERENVRKTLTDLAEIFKSAGYVMCETDVPGLKLIDPIETLKAHGMPDGASLYSGNYFVYPLSGNAAQPVEA